MTAAASPLARFGALSFTYFAAVGLYNPYAPLWLHSLGLSTLAIGSIASLQSWTRVFAPYAWSWVGDHHSGRRIELLRLACAAALIASLGFLGVQSLAAVAVVAALLFITNGGVVPLFETTLAQHLHTGGGLDAGRYGRVRMWGSVGFLIAVALFGVLLEWRGIGVFPWFLAGIYVLLLAAALRLPTVGQDSSSTERAPPVLPLLRRPEVGWFFGSAFFTVLAHTALYAFFSLYLDSMGHGKAVVGALWAVSVAVEIGFFWAQGRVFKRFTPQRLVEVAALVTAARFALIAAAGSWMPALLVAQLAHAITFGAHHAACIATVHRLFPGRLRGRGQALYAMLGYGLPGVVGGVGGGWLISRLGFASVFWAASLCALLGWGCARRARVAAVAAG